MTRSCVSTAWARAVFPTPPGPNIATRAGAAGAAGENIRSMIFFSSASRPKKTCGRTGRRNDLDYSIVTSGERRAKVM